MNAPKIDPEMLAALLDGRLSDAEREEVIARLASSEAELEAYVDAVAVVSELEAAEAGGGEADATAGDDSTTAEAHTATAPPADSPPRDSGSRRFGSAARRPAAATPAGGGGVVRRFVRSPRRLAMAAAIAAVALASVLWMQTRAGGPPDPAALAALVVASSDGGTPVGRDWAPLWSTTRSAAEPIARSARAARIGVRLVDLEIAVRTRDAAGVATLAGEIAMLLDGVPAGGPAAAIYRNIAAQPTTPPDGLAEPLERGRAAVASLVDDDVLGLAAWAEAARLAAAGRDVEFFRAYDHRRVLERAAEHPAVSPGVRGAVAALAAAFDEDDAAHDFIALERGIQRTLRALTE